jgi:AraC family transcriptional regulator
VCGEEVSVQDFCGLAAADIAVDFGFPDTGRGFGLQKQLDLGPVTFASGEFAGSEGRTVAFSKVTVAAHRDGPLRLDWRAPGSDRVLSSTVHRGQVMLADAAMPVWKRWAGSRSIFAVALDKSFVRRIANEACNRDDEIPIEPELAIEDTAIKHLTALAYREFEDGGTAGRLYAEGIAISLAVKLAQRSRRSREVGPVHCGGLASVRLKRVVEFIEEHLGDDLGLVELAEVAGLSTHHFGESFKRSTGMALHRYVVERRLQRARGLLGDTEMPIGEIAFTVGFSSQSHFTVSFRRLTGVTPKVFRDAPF